MSRVASALAQLDRADRELRAKARAFHTLDPEREQPTPLCTVAERLIERAPDIDTELACALCGALERIARGQLEHFPDNLFWDLDYVATSLLRAGQGDARGPRRIERLAQLFARLQHRFGCNSPIRFRYVHDFIYGLDWERWAARDPVRHGAVGPFDRRFLARVLLRGRDILRRIERGDDPTFPPLAPGEWRNPFAFSRAPEHELMLHRDLAQRGAIPVPCWRADAEPDFRKPASAIRVRRARDLGIPGRYD